MAEGGSYLVRCGSQDRHSGTLNRFTVNFAAQPSLQQVSAVRIHSVSFPNSQVNIPAYRNTFCIGEQEPSGFPYYRSTRELPIGSEFKLFLTPDGAPLPILITVVTSAAFPPGTHMQLIASHITNKFLAIPEAATADLQMFWAPQERAFELEWQDASVAIQALGEPSANDPYIFEFFELDENGYPDVVINGFRFGIQTFIVPYRTVVISPGQYTAEELATELTTATNLVYPGSAFTAQLIDEDRNPRFQFTSLGEFVYFSEYDTNGVSTLSRALGISETSPLSTLFVAQCVPNLRGLTIVSLQSRTIGTARCVQAATKYLENQSIALSTVTEIPVDTEWLTWVNYRPVLNQALMFPSSINLTSIEFTIRDPTSAGGQLIEMCEPGIHILLEVTVG